MVNCDAFGQGSEVEKEPMSLMTEASDRGTAGPTPKSSSKIVQCDLMIVTGTCIASLARETRYEAPASCTITPVLPSYRPPLIKTCFPSFIGKQKRAICS